MRNEVFLFCTIAAVNLFCTVTQSRAAEAADASPEQKVLDRELGKWHQTYTFFKAEWTPKQTQETGTASITRILNGRFVEEKLKPSDGSSTQLILKTYDAQRKCYRRWDFHSNGTATESTGKWDADAKCMTWSGSAGNGLTTTTTDRYVDANTIQSSVVIKERNGKECLHVEVKSTQIK